MRAGLTVGQSATVSTVVTENMVARLGGQKVHPVLATVQMIEWMEWAGRNLILPYLEENDEAVGYAVDIVHLAPTLVGETFTCTATLRAQDGNRLIADVIAENRRGIIGRGSFTQVLVAKSDLKKRLDALENALDD